MTEMRYKFSPACTVCVVARDPADIANGLTLLDGIASGVVSAAFVTTIFPVVADWMVLASCAAIMGAGVCDVCAQAVSKSDAQDAKTLNLLLILFCAVFCMILLYAVWLLV
ncbi:hypothetical protein [Craterilacuibacter sp.]|uniref:hypothetical protein n=1 Tax=Craterilacuibacter sp. TaxID=2870909 RepID=UPI003F66C53D